MDSHNATSTPESMDLLFKNIHSSWLLDSMFLFVLLPLGAIGLVLHMLAFAALGLISKKSTQAIYKYLHIHSLNSALGLVVITFSFLSFAPHFFAFALDWHARFYHCVVISFATTFYLFKNVLDVVIALELLSLLVVWLRRFTTRSPYLVSLILFLVCSLINSPAYFIAQAKSDADFYNLTMSAVTNNYCNKQAFFRTTIGTSITFAFFICRDFLTIIAEIAFSVMTVRQLHDFRFVHQFVSNFGGGDARIAESERQLILITVYILIVSVASHIVVFLCYVSFALGLENVFDGWLNFLGMLSLVVSACVDFFIIFFHSRVFRDTFRRLIRLNKLCSKNEAC